MAIFFAVHPGMYNTTSFGEVFGTTPAAISSVGGRSYWNHGSFMTFNSTQMPLVSATSTVLIFQGWVYVTDNTAVIILDTFEGGGFQGRFGINASSQLYYSATTTLGTSTETISTATWYYLQLYVRVHDTTGQVIIKLDGTEVVNVNNVDTKNTGTGYINAVRYTNDTDIYYGPHFFADASGSDFTALSTDILDLTLLVPDGAGNSTQFTPSTGANYQTVDENPVSQTDYNESSTDTHKDTFAMEDATSAIDVPYCVIPYVIGERTDATAFSLNAVVRHSSSEAAGADKTMALTMLEAKHYAHVNPSTGIAWTKSEASAMECGYEAST
jgi:hypothetical protein